MNRWAVLRLGMVSSACWATAMAPLPTQAVEPAQIAKATDLAAQETGLAVQTTGLDGSVQSLGLESIDAKGQLLATDGSRLPLDSLRQIRTSQSLLGDDPTTSLVTLRGGGEVNSREISLADGQLKLTTDLAELTYPMFDITSVTFIRNTHTDELQAIMATPSGESDRLLVSTSQGPRTVEGLVESLNKVEVGISYEDASRTIQLDKVIALVPAQLDSGQAIKYVVTTIDRSKLLADRLTFEQQQWTIAWGKATVTLPAAQVVSIEIRSDRLQYVSDLVPQTNELQTLLAPPQDTRWDASVTGAPLRLLIPAGDVSPGDGEPVVRQFSKGIGTHARSRLVYAVPPGCSKLMGWVGIDHGTNGQGRCRCSILLDGISVFTADLVGGEAAVPIDIALDGAVGFELLVEPGEQLDLADWVNWADLRLLK